MKLRLAIGLFTALAMSACTEVVNDIPTEQDQTTPYEFSYSRILLPPPRLPADNKLTEEGIALGRMLFYDPILSGDSSQSCASCHSQEFAFTDSENQFSTGITGAVGTRNSMPLFNLMWHLDGFFWDGRAETLEHQALMPIQDPTEMNETLDAMLLKLNRSTLYRQAVKKAFNQEEITSKHVAQALEQFMLTLISSNSKFDQVFLGQAEFTDQEKVGQIIFNTEAIPKADDDPVNPRNYGGDCFHCHGNSLFTSREFRNNGLDSVLTDLGRATVTGKISDQGKFKTPSLRNIEVTAPYMHDGRFETLEEVLDFYFDGGHKNSPNLDDNMHALKEPVYLSEEHRKALIAYLKTLTDESFFNKRRIQQPF